MKPCFVLDNSVVMRWFFGDGMESDLEYATHVLDAMPASTALVPAVWSLEVVNVIARAEAKKLVTEANVKLLSRCLKNWIFVFFLQRQRRK